MDANTRLTPVELAALVYEQEPCARTFREDLEGHLINGYVFSTPELFLMGRAVDSSAPYEVVTDPWQVFARERCDAWLCYLAAGDLTQMPGLIPYELPKIGFERGNILRYYRYGRLTNKILCSTTLIHSAARISTAT